MTDTNDRAPWWAAFIPGIREWATLGMFALIFYLLHLIAAHPELKENELFKTVATLLVGSGAFGLVCAFLWGGSKASAAAADTVNHMARQPIPAPAPSPGTVTTTTTGPATPADGTATITAAPDVDVLIRDKPEGDA